MAGSSFCESPIQGNPTEGHEISIPLGDGITGSGQVFDRPLELSDNLPAYEKLQEESRPISEFLRKSLYPNVEPIPQILRLLPSGSLDAGRLALADFSPIIFKRYRMREKDDPRGRPVLVIACDGSGSLNKHQMRMLKVLAAAWLNSTARNNIQVLACLYHSGQVRGGLAAPLSSGSIIRRRPRPPGAGMLPVPW